MQTSIPDKTLRFDFNYLKSPPAMCLYDENLKGDHLQFLRDLLGACAYLSNSGKLEFSGGEFHWPITGSGGSPERALAAFFKKHEINKENQWLLVSENVMKLIGERLELNARVLEIPTIGRLAGDASLKRQLWERLKQHA